MKNEKLENEKLGKDNEKKENMEIEKNPINIIYHDENLKFGGGGIIRDCQKIQKEIKCSLILTDNLNNLKVLLQYISKNHKNSKFLLVVNGSSAEKTINFLKKNDYISLFINGCIYTKDEKKYAKIKDKNPNFIVKISITRGGVINYIKNIQDTILNNEINYININPLINYESYINGSYFDLHKQLSIFYGDNSEKTFNDNYKSIKDFINNDKNNLSDKEKEELINYCFKSFSFLKDNNYENIISTFLKYETFYKYINELLIKKEISIYNHIGYFVGNLMFSLVEYGKKKHKAINFGSVFYRVIQLNIIEVLEFLKNRDCLISFPHFISMTNKKSLFDLILKKSIRSNNNNDLFSVTMKIEYLYDEGYEPVIFNLRDLAQYPDEEEYILLPFTFLFLKKIIIDSTKSVVDIDLEIIGKKEVLETYIKEGKTIHYDKDNHIMIINNN